jgi:3-isopropylmalate dehydrogenase
MRLCIAVLPGDGVGPEVTAAAVHVLEAVCARFGHRLDVDERPIGWAALQGTGAPLPPETVEACLSADAVLLGAVGDPAADRLPPPQRPETGLLELRRALGCWANLRPARLADALLDRSPLRADVVRGTDMLVVRELSGGIYYGEPRREGDATTAAVNTMTYDEASVRRIAEFAFDAARGRRGAVVSVDKANVLEVSRLWRRIVDEVAAGYPDVRCEHMLVDRAAMELVLAPAAFDVILTSNLFGDILSDEAAAVVGSIGLLPSASVGGGVGLYEPVHGSAPTIAGRDEANPIGTILSVALMLRHTFELEEEAAAIEDAVDATLARGLRTLDLAPDSLSRRRGDRPDSPSQSTRPSPGGDPGRASTADTGSGTPPAPAPAPVGTRAFAQAIADAVLAPAAAQSKAIHTMPTTGLEAG